MNISNNIIKMHLQNVYFLSGGTYGGKTTMSKILEEKYGFIRYCQDDHFDEFSDIAKPSCQPALSFDRSKDWHGYFSQPPKQHADRLDKSLFEEAEFVIMDLIKLSKNKKVIADVCIPTEILLQIADKKQVVLLFAPEEMTRKHYFDRADKDEVYQFIRSFPDGGRLLENVIEALHYNDAESKRKYIDSGFYYIERTPGDTTEKTLALIENHFELMQRTTDMDVIKVEKDDRKWSELINYAKSCSWEAGKHLASILEQNAFEDWEGVFAAIRENEIVGFCTFLKTDYYPENKYSPWISTIFVDEKYRGNRISGMMINKTIEYAKKQGFSRVYIPSDIVGLYEKYHFKKIDELENYGGDIDSIFARDI